MKRDSSKWKGFRVAEKFSVFADTIRLKKYAHDVTSTRKETWEETAHRVPAHVFRPVKATPWFAEQAEKAIALREFMPGGRYLSSTGREFHQTQNCLLLKAEDSREGWSQLLNKSAQALMTGAGIGIVYSSIREEGKLIRRTGGKATGPLALMQMVNEAGRFVMQGGERRSAIWAGLHWWHADIFKFIRIKNWSEDVRRLKGKNFAFPATLDGTNISVILDREFFDAWEDESHSKHKLAHQVYWEVVRQMMETGEPGFSIDYDDPQESLRNAPIHAYTQVLTDSGYCRVHDIVDRPTRLFTGKQWVLSTFKQTGENVPVVEVVMSHGASIVCDPAHEFILFDGNRVPAAKLQANAALKTFGPEASYVESVEPCGTADVYCCDVGVDEHSFVAEGVIISNCTEITSSTSDDICNLGSINMARVDSLDHMKHLVDVGTAFLLAGTVYSHVPYSEVDQVRTKNRRLGLGLMGIHEWLLKRGKRYGPDAELEEYLKVYASSTDVAHDFARMWELTPPIKTRAIAPTGTIGIVAETTTGIEPIFCAAYKRRYLKGKDVFQYQYVVDPTAKRLVDSGIRPEDIEDAYSLAEDVERRVSFQAWVQQYVDHGISSTINLPSWGSENNNETKVRDFGEMLMKHLPKIRGITCYPDGAREGQPLTAVSLREAMEHEGQIFEEQGDVCKVSRAGGCGD